MLTSDQVRRIAKLARLGLSDRDAEKFSHQLTSIFQSFEKLNELDTDKVVPTSQVTGLKNVMREDEVKLFAAHEKLLDCSPLSTEQNQILVPKVLTSSS